MSAGRIPNNGTAAIQSTIVTTKGDILAATSASVISRLAVGATNGMVLTVDSSEATGLKYATPSSSAFAYTFTTYTPTVTAQTGTITTSTATGQYVQFGKLVTALFNVHITDAGSGAGTLRVGLPVAAVAGNMGGFYPASGNERAATGKAVSGVTNVPDNANRVGLRFFDFSTCIATGNQIVATIIYEVA